VRADIELEQRGAANRIHRQFFEASMVRNLVATSQAQGGAKSQRAINGGVGVGIGGVLPTTSTPSLQARAKQSQGLYGGPAKQNGGNKLPRLLRLPRAHYNHPVPSNAVVHVLPPVLPFALRRVTITEVPARQLVEWHENADRQLLLKRIRTAMEMDLRRLRTLAHCGIDSVGTTRSATLLHNSKRAKNDATRTPNARKPTSAINTTSMRLLLSLSDDGMAHSTLMSDVFDRCDELQREQLEAVEDENRDIRTSERGRELSTYLVMFVDGVWAREEEVALLELDAIHEAAQVGCPSNERPAEDPSPDADDTAAADGDEAPAPASKSASTRLVLSLSSAEDDHSHSQLIADLLDSPAAPTDGDEAPAPASKSASTRLVLSLSSAEDEHSHSQLMADLLDSPAAPTPAK
jgi:hypothetical protein